MHRLPRPTPALAVSLVALFFALGGTAFAVNQKSAPQPRCGAGSVRGVAVISGGQFGLDTLPNSFTSDSKWFTYGWNCGGGKISIRKPPDFPGIEVQFAGNPAQVAVVQANPNGIPNAGSVYRGSDGGFWVSMGGANVGEPGPWQPQSNVPFTIVLM
jgi:hypothetical protein